MLGAQRIDDLQQLLQLPFRQHTLQLFARRERVRDDLLHAGRRERIAEAFAQFAQRLRNSWRDIATQVLRRDPVVAYDPRDFLCDVVWNVDVRAPIRNAHLIVLRRLPLASEAQRRQRITHHGGR